MRCCRWYSAGICAVFVSVAVLGITLSTFPAATAQEEGGPPAVQPGEEHALLASLVGRWAAETHFRTTPDQPVTVSKLTSLFPRAVPLPRRGCSPTF